MDLPAQRRAGAAKYGKNKGKTLGYNFFTNDPKPLAETLAPSTASSKRLPLSPLSASSEVSNKDEPAISVVRTSPSPSTSAQPAHIISHSSSSFSIDTDSRSGSPLPPALTSSARADISTFEILSSDDEHKMVAPRPSKRRKITQVLKESKPNLVDVDSVTVPTIPKTKRSALKKSKHQESLAKKNSSEIDHLELQSSSLRRGKDTDSPPVLDISDGQKPVRRSSKTRLKGAGHINKAALSHRSKLTASNDYELPIEDIQVEVRPPRRVRTFVKTKTEDASTPKKQQHHLTDSEASVASPGSIGFNDLRLTPDRGSTHQPSPDPVSPISTPNRRGRLRRIDMLDAPKESGSKPTSRAPSISGSASIETGPVDKEVGRYLSQPRMDEPTLSRSGSSQRQTYGRNRNTYGKERSHLADMVDSLDVLSNSGSQETSERTASQLGNSSQPSQLNLEMELDDSSGDDAAPGLKLKSIHELRQAGSNDRFDRDLEGLLADIDPSVKTTPKASRLSSCIKLFTKLNQEAFAAFVSDRGLDRIADWTKTVSDNISKLLLISILWRLIHTKNTSPIRMRSIFQAVVSGTILITDLGSMLQMSKSRNENLSKRTIRDLEQFEETVLRENLLPAYEGTVIIPTAVVLGTLHDSLRKLIEMGTTTISINKTSYKKILMILNEACQPMDEDTLHSRYITKLILSLLHLFSGPLNDDLGLSEEEYLDLGDTLSALIDRAKGKHEDLVQSIFHFVIGLCNDRPDICLLLSKSELGTSAMAIINDRFNTLADTAVANMEVDSVMLDSIILSLTSLSFLAEHDAQVRQRFAHQTFSASNTIYIEMLATLYVQTAPRLTNAATAEKMQALIALGYLSILICILCLETSLKDETLQILTKASCSISDVVASAKELLIHIQALDADQSNMQIDGAVDSNRDTTFTSTADGFWGRWATIVESVRLS